ncbi:MAG: SPOR domain-containing protein [Pseudomonadota bacterium]
MSRNLNNRAAPAKKGGSLLAGILIGVVIGVALAAGVAWFIMKSPSPYLQQPTTQTPPVGNVPTAEPTVATPDVVPANPDEVVDNKPRFEFYQVLTDKQGATDATPPPARPKVQPDEKPKAAFGGEAQYLQAGSFSKESDAEKQRAKLAILGIESDIYSVTIPNRGVWHRVRLGPYKNAEQMAQAHTFLKQNGVDATPMRAQ